jgi:dihydrofolate synthase/folylpolyglutamate synthase
MKPASEFWTYSPDSAVEAAVSKIYDSYPPLLRGTLDIMRGVLKKLGNPHLSLPPVFHVAGTNGKGSTLAFLQAIFEASGRSVHKFTSPHLIRFEERFVFNNGMVSESDLLSLIAEVDAAARGEAISFFEFFNILFFVAAARRPADAVLLETGLGGLLDSTNVVENTACVTLTRISRDHTHLLGNTLTDIAAQKAGIIKPGCRVVIAPQSEAAVTAVFEKAAAEKAATVAGWETAPTNGGFIYKSATNKFSLPSPALPGAHQVINAGTAIAAVEAVRPEWLTTETLSLAMRDVRWPGRLQRLTEGKLAALLPEGWELWLDGAHNDSGAEVLAAELDRAFSDKPLHIITAFKGRKDPAEFYGPLKNRVKTVQVVAATLFSDMPSVPMLEAEDLCDRLDDMGFDARVTATLEDAVRYLTFPFTVPQRILVTGSLYLVGHALKVNA